MDQQIFEIKDGSNFLKIAPLKWAHPKAHIDWDRNAIQSKITMKGGGFQGQVGCDLMTVDFEFLKRTLKTLYNNLNHQATLTTLEGHLEIIIRGDGIGHFSVDCQLTSEIEIGNKLIIALSFDQTLIPSLVGQLERIIKTFPIQGTALKIRNE